MDFDDFDRQAEEFCEKFSVKVTIAFNSKRKFSDNDIVEGNVYDVTIERNGKKYSYEYEDSLLNAYVGKEPKAYDILSTLIKDEPEVFSEFCEEYSLSTKEEEESREIYKEIWEEYNNVQNLFSDCMDELREIR